MYEKDILQNPAVPLCQPINKELQRQKYTKLKEQIKKYVLENYKYIYLLGQIYFGEGNYNLLKKYAKYCIDTGHFADHGDIALIVSITKLVQKYSTSSLDVWQCLLKELNLKEIPNERTQKRIKKCFKETIK